MAVENGYAALDDLQQRLNIGTGAAGSSYTGDRDEELADAINTASRAIDRYCGRMFWKNTATASARRFRPYDRLSCQIDDCWSITSVKTDAAGDATYETTWATTDYETHPINGVVSGVSGWPTTDIVAVAGRYFPLTRSGSAFTVQVTGQWGWSATPAEVRSACLILAAELFKLREAPFGAVGFQELGIVRVRENPRVQMLLAPFCRTGGTSFVGVF